MTGTRRSVAGNTRPRWGDRILRLIGAATLGGGILMTGALVFHRPVLDAVGDFLVVSDPPVSADGIFLLNGGLLVRPQRAAELYRQGFAPKIVIARAAPEVLVGHDRIRAVTDIALEVLRSSGVPDTSLVVLPVAGGTQSTEEEARALAAYLRSRPAERLLVVTSDYHTRRARWTLLRELDGTSIDIRMVPAREVFSRDVWWRTEKGMLLYLEEYLKFAHTWLRGF